MILVSGCLYGENCKYNGGHNLSKGVKKYCEDRQTVLVCPEVLGGLSIPRSPAEIVGGTAKDVLDGKAKVINCKGRDVTGAFIQGAYLTLDIAKKNNINLAILKANSPSCGKGKIYDGHFQKKLIVGNGITAELLLREGIEVITELDL